AVPAPRLPEHSSQDLPVLPPPAAAPAAPVAPAVREEASQDAEELVVPWQAVAPAGIEGFAAQTGPRGAGTRRRPEGEALAAAVPEPLSAPQPVLLEPEDGEEDYDLSYDEAEDAEEAEGAQNLAPFDEFGEFEDEDDYQDSAAEPAPPQPAAPQPAQPQPVVPPQPARPQRV
ncbi:hypothetical protein KDL01_41795, partial [Actinospica durhamensis]